jgi:hypothetical protein
MSIGGLVARAALLKEQMKKKPCKRCGLHYNHLAKNECPHCSHLDEAALVILFSKKEAGYQGRKSLGMLFFIAALITGFLLLILSNG